MKKAWEDVEEYFEKETPVHRKKITYLKNNNVISPIASSRHDSIVSRTCVAMQYVSFLL